MTFDQFIEKLEKAGIDYDVFQFDDVRYVEVGRFGYRFDEQGHSSGGWIAGSKDNWSDEWRQWAELLIDAV